MLRTRYSSEISATDYDYDVTLAGWVQDIRNLGGIAFVQLRDGHGIVQLTAVKKDDKELFKRLTSLPRESVIKVGGTIKQNEQVLAGFELLPKSLEVLSVANAPLPLGVIDKVGAELDTRLDHRYLDLRKAEVNALFRIRHTLLRAVRTQLESESFIEIHTPKIVATATEGGTALFSMQYFENKAYLNQSPQLYKQIMMATGLDKVYEIAPAFRAEEHDTVRHLNEFTSIDIEMAFADEEDVMQVLERLMLAIIKQVNADNRNELKILGLELQEPRLPFRRIGYGECLELVESKGLEIEFGEDFAMEATKMIGEELDAFYFITRWPTASKPFYINPFASEPELCKAFDLMYREKEVTSGGQRVHDLALLKRRLKDQGLDPESFSYYLEPFEYGMPPHAGWGLGVERMLMILTGVNNIRECVLFPRDRRRLVP